MMFLSVVVLLSVAFYVAKLGFYSDDWAFLAAMTHADDESIVGLIRASLDFNTNLRMRPTQSAYQALLYSAFGLDLPRLSRRQRRRSDGVDPARISRAS